MLNQKGYMLYRLQSKVHYFEVHCSGVLLKGVEKEFQSLSISFQNLVFSNTFSEILSWKYQINNLIKGKGKYIKTHFA